MNFHSTNSFNNRKLLLKHKIIAAVCVVFMLIPFVNYAQTQSLARHETPYNLTLKSDGVVGKNNSQVITEEVSETGATWLRLFFKDVNLGNNSTITITSKLDGATQTLTSKTIKDWNNSSAYFNGDAVTVTLSVAANDSSVGINISELSVGELDPTVKSQCGSSDDRVDSADDAIGRIVPIGCTGWIITNGKLVTAGHCVGSRAEIIEFNVPKSNPDRTIVHPGPEDQYPIGNFVSPYPNSPSQANDWAVFDGFANSQTGQTPIQGQGASYNVTQDAPGANITITGFGTDTGIDNQTQQIHTGPLSSSTNTFVRYRTDTTGGNSGSPIIDTATGNAVGVHAYGGCSGSGGSNSGERATIPAFWDAMGLGTPPPPPTDECSGNVSSFPYSESFEGSIGAWSQSSNDDINWTVNSGGTPSNGTGPSGAVDGNSYIYVEASGNGTGYPNKQAILNAPCLNFNGVSSPTISFQYHMTGNAVGTLNVEARTNNTGNWSSVFTRSGDQGADWNAASVDLSAYAGNSSVQLRLNVVTGTSWQGDITIDDLSITNGNTPPPPTCDSLNFNDYAITGFSNQDSAGNFSIGNGGASISMTNNTWKFIPFNYNVTANTVIEFTFSSSSQGEIHGVGFEDDNTLTSSRYFKVHGTQNYGVTNFDNYSSGSTTYVIPVGNFYTGNMDRLVFINDNDAGSGNNSTFSDVKIYEGSCGQSANAESLIADLESAEAILGDEPEGIFNDVRIAPNPATNNFSIYLNPFVKKANATVFSILGQKQAEIELQPGANTISAKNLSLGLGIYLIRIESDGESITQKLIIN
ncbi:T9SS type A sorting domain-containing protein [Aquimarina sp. MMG015]|uniref:T9SS type A sorting domain-containing protein n=1 Tax=unclassified Aquimarina TaxID=2627091 RepID=UPI000E53F135|nr:MULTISPECIES: T9SS type A sorting domain-containing protein [unclassified Aquimarina]AXT54542.1 T9SS C-terminal target domain-containing protein [Aquimarina sp. AD1]MBQ4804606.1 T9SS type A sorting domain-containing protein [Aquimarina sp. MMG015]RKN16927.1 T9SS C-terminal target domain-containing protein [Aquimarina sp. AD1]